MSSASPTISQRLSSSASASSLGDLIRRQSLLRGRRIAAQNLKPSESTSWADWALEIEALKQNLRSRGVRPGSVVLHLGTNHRLLWSLAIAAIEIGSHFWPMNYRWTPREVSLALDRLPAESPLAILDQTRLLSHGESLTGRGITVLPRLALSHPCLPGTDSISAQQEVPPGSLLISTGGTTGVPRLAALDEGTLRFNAETFQEATELSEKDRVLVTAPNFHVAGFSTLTLAALQAGATLVIAPHFDPIATGKTIASEAITATVGHITNVDGHTVLTVVGKGDRRRDVPLSPLALELLAAPEPSATGHIIHRDGEPLDRYQVAHVVRSLGRAAEIGRPISPHILRHTAATLALDGGAPIQNVADLLGHSSPTTTMRYVAGRERLRDNAAYVVATALSTGVG